MQHPVSRLFSYLLDPGFPELPQFTQAVRSGGMVYWHQRTRYHSNSQQWRGGGESAIKGISTTHTLYKGSGSDA